MSEIARSSATAMTEAAEVAMFRALGHPVRLGIMKALAERPETCACDFTELFHVTQPTISQHLRVLREAGLVVTRRQGVQICYSVRPEALHRLHEVLTAIQPPRLAAAG
ncbi:MULTISPECIES: ArsR/SmtB family transcription factor [Streptomyces]|uniref:ArsR/SmtB family transcription factor n=1 Tax=Streptomyces TaxID=1883 RepID=UPI001CC94806|nr:MULTISPECIES: metalloregulator ArsR/SmtB family transcription factor [Streptomyces]UBI40693.1 metalloregulator ArsR/SmtB family transcription factor [Streptomyces mobaraensis]UKW33275.1 metalloregulator ArsR/SmtB family transcription factor [Streptomyces sp. TYQ1024]